MSAPTASRRHLLPYAVHLERRLETPRGLGAALTIGAVIVALLHCSPSQIFGGSSSSITARTSPVQP